MIDEQEEWWTVKMPRVERVGVDEEAEEMANTAQSGDQ
jgi:hypothetical protein